MKTPEEIAQDVTAKIEHDGGREFTKRLIAETIREAREFGFKVGFEHAVAGGEDAGRLIVSLRGTEPLVMYFANEADRQEMIDACLAEKPMVTTKIPERRRG